MSCIACRHTPVRKRSRSTSNGSGAGSSMAIMSSPKERSPQNKAGVGRAHAKSTPPLVTLPRLGSFGGGSGGQSCSSTKDRLQHSRSKYTLREQKDREEKQERVMEEDMRLEGHGRSNEQGGGGGARGATTVHDRLPLRMARVDALGTMRVGGSSPQRMVSLHGLYCGLDSVSCSPGRPTISTLFSEISEIFGHFGLNAQTSPRTGLDFVPGVPSLEQFAKIPTVRHWGSCPVRTPCRLQAFESRQVPYPSRKFRTSPKKTGAVYQKRVHPGAFGI